MKGLLWKGTVTHNSCPGTNSNNIWVVPLSYPEALELSVELHRSSHRRSSKTKGVLIIFATFTRKDLSQGLIFVKVAGLRCFPMNFTKLLRTPISKNICERLLLVADSRTRYQLNRRYLLLLPCYVYINISVASYFFFFYSRFFFVNICFGSETKLANGKLHEELRPVLKCNWIFSLPRQLWSCGICRLKFCTYRVILTMTKTGYNIRNSKSHLPLHNIKEV